MRQIFCTFYLFQILAKCKKSIFSHFIFIFKIIQTFPVRQVNRILFLFFITSSLLFSQTESLESLFGLGRPPAKHFIIVDVSGSMRTHFQRVISACSVIPQALEQEDTVSIFIFATWPKKICSKRAREIRSQDFPQTCAGGSEGQYTDIWEVLEEVILEMNKSNQDIFTIFFLTDGRDEPPPGADRSNERWQRIINSADSIISRKSLIAYGIGLGAFTDVNLVTQIFGTENTRILIQSPYRLKRSIDSIVRDVKRRLLKAAVNKEINEGKIEIVQKKIKEKKDKILLNYLFTSRYQHLPVRVTVEGEESIILPKKSKIFTLYNKKPPLSKWRIGRRIYRLPERKLCINASFQHKREIENLGLAPDVKFESPKINYTIKYGIPVSFFLTFFISIVLLVIFGKKWLSLPTPLLFGRITFKSKDYYLSDYKSQKLHINIRENGEEIIISTTEGEETIFSLIAEREGNFEKIYLKPGKKFFFLTGGEIKDDPYNLNLGTSKVILSEMAPRLSLERKWLNFLIVTILLFIINLVTFKIGP